MPLQAGTTLVAAISQGATPVSMVYRGTDIVWQAVVSTNTLVVTSSPGAQFASFSGTGDLATPLTGFIGGNGQHSTTREASVKVNRAGILRWDCGVSSEANYDFGRLLIDGVQRFAISGTQTNVGTATVTTATAVILRYNKDISVTTGQDRMNVNSLVIADPPGTPTNLAGTASATSVALSWTAPTTTGSYAISDYRVEYGQNTNAFSLVSRTASTAASQMVTGLTPSTDYVFRVAAVSQIGTGSFAAPLSKTTSAPTAPGAPTGLTATPYAGYDLVGISWAAPADDGGAAITDYTIQYSSNGGTSWSSYSWSGFGSNENIYGLTAGTEYTFRVAAVNSAGTSAWSSTATATP